MTLALLLGIPLLACALSAMSRRRAVLEAVNVGAFVLTFLLALVVAAEVLRFGPISLWNGFIYADALSALSRSRYAGTTKKLLGVIDYVEAERSARADPSAAPAVAGD